MRIVLVGCRGAGKTVVGKLVARRLHLKFLDTDKIVEKVVGKSISEIFRARGERFFRAIESEAIRSIRDKDGVLIAAGGGAPMRKSNVANLRKGGAIIFYLCASAEILHQRCRADSRTLNQRPPLTSESGLAEIRRILKARERTYRLIADATIDTSSCTPSQVAGEITRLIKKFAQKCERGFCDKPREGAGRLRRAQGAHL